MTRAFDQAPAHRFRAACSLSVFAMACAPSAPDRADNPVAHDAEAHEPAAPVASTCETSLDPERLDLSINSAITLASGLQVHYVGTTIDHYEDGSFEPISEFHFYRGEDQADALVSALADPAVFDDVLDHCWRLVEANADGAIVEVAPSAASAPRLAPCADQPSSLPVFDSYYAVDEGAQFQATIRYDTSAHEWMIEPQPRIVHHHATRLEWSNLAAMGRAGLGHARDRDVRVSFRFESSEVTHVPERRQWLSEHVATIESACLP